MAALHAGLGEEMLTRDSDFLEKKERRYSMFILINDRKPWDGGLLQGVYGSPACKAVNREDKLSRRYRD